MESEQTVQTVRPGADVPQRRTLPRRSARWTRSRRARASRLHPNGNSKRRPFSYKTTVNASGDPLRTFPDANLVGVSALNGRTPAADNRGEVHLCPGVTQPLYDCLFAGDLVVNLNGTSLWASHPADRLLGLSQCEGVDPC